MLISELAVCEYLCLSLLKTPVLKPNPQLGPEDRPLMNVSSAVIKAATGAALPLSTSRGQH